MRRVLVFGLVSMVGIFAGRTVAADAVVLSNGDALHGDVVSLEGDTLVLENPNLGTVSLKRNTVKSIHFGDVRLDQVSAAHNRPAESKATAAGVAQPERRAGGVNLSPATPEGLIGKLTGKSLPAAANEGESLEGAVQQLQAGGITPQAISEVQKALPLLNTPEVKEYFNSTVGGLMSGSLNVQDVRKDAVKARDMIVDLKKDLGPEAAALDGYLAILNGFIEDTEPAQDPGTRDSGTKTESGDIHSSPQE